MFSQACASHSVHRESVYPSMHLAWVGGGDVDGVWTEGVWIGWYVDMGGHPLPPPPGMYPCL